MRIKEANIAIVVGAVALFGGILIAGGDASDSTRQLISAGAFVLALTTLIVLSERADRKSSRR